MRSDRKLKLSAADLAGRIPRPDIRQGPSFSGHERNHLFVQVGGEFVEASSVSGLDHPGDGRVVSILDVDRDGWQDLAVVNANAPWLQLFHNRIGEVSSNRFVALRFIGGNHKAEPSSLSARDGFGARVTLHLGDRKLVREHHCGEGMAAQNSGTVVIGIGDRESVDAIEVRWPGGKTARSGEVAAGSLVTLSETGTPFQTEPYTTVKMPTASAPAKKRFTLGEGEGLRMYVAMSTTCKACKAELPHLKDLRERTRPEALAMFGIPIDAKDTPGKLQKYVRELSPAYRLLTDLSQDQIEATRKHLHETLGTVGQPATILTDAEDRVLLTRWGVPTLSDLRRLGLK